MGKTLYGHYLVDSDARPAGNILFSPSAADETGPETELAKNHTGSQGKNAFLNPMCQVSEQILTPRCSMASDKEKAQDFMKVQDIRTQYKKNKERARGGRSEPS